MKDEPRARCTRWSSASRRFTRPYFIATGTPAELVTILRTAFDATMRDPQFLADAEKMHIDVSPLPGATVQDLIVKLYATPKKTIEQATARRSGRKARRLAQRLHQTSYWATQIA